jgi:hypothetical protein
VDRIVNLLKDFTPQEDFALLKQQTSLMLLGKGVRKHFDSLIKSSKKASKKATLIVEISKQSIEAKSRGNRKSSFLLYSLSVTYVGKIHYHHSMEIFFGDKTSWYKRYTIHNVTIRQNS